MNILKKAINIGRGLLSVTKYLQYIYAILNGVNQTVNDLEAIDNGKKIMLTDNDNNGKADLFETKNR